MGVNTVTYLLTYNVNVLALDICNFGFPLCYLGCLTNAYS